MAFSDDQLISYLLGEASSELRSSIEDQLAQDLDLVQRLSSFRNALGMVDSVHGVYEPPSDLFETTLDRIDALEGDCPASNSNSDAAANESLNPNSETVVRRAKAGLSPATWRGKNRVSFRDSVALTLSLSLLFCLALPALLRARFESRKAQCADNLRMTGEGLFTYATNDPQGRFPAVDLQGSDAFAGVYAVKLQSAGIPVEPTQLQCASLAGSIYDQATPVLDAIPTLQDLRQLSMEQIVFLQNVVGGNYAYNLGVVENQIVMAPRYEGRSHFAILADSPVIEGNTARYVAHDGIGVNTLYEDGRVVFIDTPRFILSNTSLDHPFRNLDGLHAVGLTPQDASLAPSNHAPLGFR